ncbi:hypothetical protein CH305_09680 [Rhodococcus sp. 15-649-2-2]|nr:hypothetical protein CH305_09680 [Rhodococcus sp. 15-649-2-2]
MRMMVTLFRRELSKVSLGDMLRMSFYTCRMATDSRRAVTDGAIVNRGDGFDPAETQECRPALVRRAAFSEHRLPVEIRR